MTQIHWYVTRDHKAKHMTQMPVFFCDGKSEKRQLHQISAFNTGDQLRKVVESSNNEQWKVNLSAAVDPKDARAIDINITCLVG